MLPEKNPYEHRVVKVCTGEGEGCEYNYFDDEKSAKNYIHELVDTELFNHEKSQIYIGVFHYDEDVDDNVESSDEMKCGPDYCEIGI